MKDRSYNSKTRFCSGGKHRRWTGCGELSGGFYTTMRCRAIRKGTAWEVSIEYLWELFMSQLGECALTGIPLDMPGPYRKNTTASLDRIDSNLGYVIGNVQWVHKEVNYMKHKLSQERFIELCEKVANKHGSRVQGGH